MSKVGDIIDALELEVVDVTTGYVMSKYNYDQRANNLKTNRRIFSIRPSSASTVTGATLRWTVDQEFQIILTTDFINKNDNDEALHTALVGLYGDHDNIGKRIYLRRLNLTYVMAVTRIDIDAPEIDNDNNIVTLVGRYIIKYNSQI